MKATKIEDGILHTVPDDIKEVLLSNSELLDRWNNLTPIQRNEWICWTTIVKQDKTRKNHIKRLQEEILDSKKQPCCWPGCPHRRPNAQKWFK